MNPSHEEESTAERPGRIPVSNRLPAMFRTITEHEFFGEQGGYPSVHEGSCFMHEGRRVIPEIHGDGFPEQLYQLDGCFTLEFDEV